MSNPRVAFAREEGKMNTLFPLLHPTDAASGQGPPKDTSGKREQHHDTWESLWADGSFLPWERGGPHPALHDALVDRRDILGDALHEPGSNLILQERRKALVPGCGRAYDVFQLRSFGYDALGIDVSNTAVANAAELDAKISANKTSDQDLAATIGYGVKDNSIGMGTAKVEIGDFFNMQGRFDIIFDYTFLCALPPSLRPQWAISLSRLLAPSGRLICVEFPTSKPTDSGGPPWALRQEVYLAHLHRPGKEVRYDDGGKVDAEDAAASVGEGGLERIARWHPQRTHAAGKDSDMVSIWRHAGSA